MAWSGGTFSRVHNWQTDKAGGVNPQASRFDAEDDNFRDGINLCLHKGGQNAATADLSMGGFKLTNVAAPVSGTDAANQDYVLANAAGPTGTLIAWLDDVGAIPAGWLLCDGAGYSTVTYSVLHAAIAYRYGGSGGTFNVPDMSGEVPLGPSRRVVEEGSHSGTTFSLAGTEGLDPSFDYELDMRAIDYTGLAADLQVAYATTPSGFFTALHSYAANSVDTAARNQDGDGAAISNTFTRQQETGHDPKVLRWHISNGSDRGFILGTFGGEFGAGASANANGFYYAVGESGNQLRALQFTMDNASSFDCDYKLTRIRRSEPTGFQKTNGNAFVGIRWLIKT